MRVFIFFLIQFNVEIHNKYNGGWLDDVMDVGSDVGCGQSGRHRMAGRKKAKHKTQNNDEVHSFREK